MKCVLAFLLVLFSSVALGQGSDQGLRKIEKMLYGDLKKIKYFGLINAWVQNTDGFNPNSKNDIGLSSQELTDFVRLRFKNNFANIQFKDESANISKLTESEQTQIGWLWCNTWTVGKTYPVAYHVECKMGTVKKFDIVTDASLGVANVENAKEGIRKALDRMVMEFAQQFFRVRDEM